MLPEKSRPKKAKSPEKSVHASGADAKNSKDSSEKFKKELVLKRAQAQKHHALLSTPDMEAVLQTLSDTYGAHPMDELTRQDPYKVLIACILSLRTKDETMIPASERLFALADTPETMIKLKPEMIRNLIFPVGFYKTKADTILEISRRLLADYDGIVPDTIDDLLAFKGVGRKTANLVVGLGYRLPAICVDTHVHRISNRLGYLVSKTPEETETILRDKLPQAYWPIINKVLVLHGQQICKPIGARCDVCPISERCMKVDVRARKVSG